MLPVVPIHGFIGSLDDDRLVAGLAPRVVLAPELLGYGSHREVGPGCIDLGAQDAELARALEPM
jgi:lipase